jgi:hypothetical protein
MRTSPVAIGTLTVAALVILACGGSGGGSSSSGGSTSSSSGGSGTTAGGTGPAPILDPTPKVRFANFTEYERIRDRVNGVTIVDNLEQGQFFDRVFTGPDVYWSVTDATTGNYVFGGYQKMEYSFQVFAFAGSNSAFNWLDFPIGYSSNFAWVNLMSAYKATPNLDAGWRRISQTDAQRTVVGPVGAIQSGGNALTGSFPVDSPLFVGFYERGKTNPIAGTVYGMNLDKNFSYFHAVYTKPDGDKGYITWKLSRDTIKN